MVYRVLADGIDIFGSDTESSLLSPSLETELNSAGSLEFTLPPDHPSYDDISLMQTEMEVYEDDDLIFFGRPAEVGIDWNKQKKVVCEGALAYLNDAAIRPHKFEGALISDVFKYIIAQYNAQVAQNKQFIVGNITIVDRYVYTEFDYDICLSVLISTCIDSTGGYLFLRKEEAGIYIDWLAEVPDASDQPVQFASNMLDLNQDTRAEDICTVVLPVGGQVDGANITIAPVNQGSDILEDSDAIAKYGRILKIQQWNDIVDPQALKDKATEWLAKQQEDDITIETDAAELHYLDGSVGAYRIGQLVNVISGPHGVDKEYPILKMSMNLDSGTKKITLGTPPRKELTELSGITNSTGGGSSSGGGGGSSDAVIDVIVNGSSVVSNHIARISAVTPQQLNDGLATKANQSDLNALSTAVAGKASQADLNALSTAVAAKQDQLTPGTGISIDANNVISATGGGGTEVEANPSEPATDDLNTIKIGDTVYNIPSSGGMVMMSDYYSEEEQVVGRWTDGKPLYQKTYRNISITNNADNVVDSNFGTDKNICTHDIEFRGISGNYRSDYNNSTSDTLYSNNNGQLIYYFYKTGNWSQLFDTLDVTVQYTKTTDAPGTGPTKGNLIYLPALYSEEEREVGVWTDGKPLYQKTWDLGAETLLNGATYISTIDISGMEKILPGKAIGEQYVQSSPIMAYNDNNKLYVVPNAGIYVRYITLQYTKTTDQPGSGTWTPEGQLAHHYSTSEKIVGTWIDGSTVYERTQNGGISISTNDTWYDTIFTGVNKVISFNCSLLRDGEEIGSTFNNGHIDYIVRNNIVKIKGYNFSIADSFVLDKLTIQYTKT
jgi:hypothetical protein